MGLARVLCVLELVVVVAASASDPLFGREEAEKKLIRQLINPYYEFEQWVEEHRPAYLKGSKEWETRFQIWLSNLQRIVDYNKEHESHWLAMNKFSDVTNDEFQKRFQRLEVDQRSHKLQHSDFIHPDVDLTTLPRFINWRLRGAVTRVKNQGKCGSCWTFSITGSIEGLNAIRTGKLVSLSEQEMLDCSEKGQYDGCKGYWLVEGFNWVINNGGLTTEANYPYTGSQHRCNLKKERDHYVSIDNYKYVPANQGSLLWALTKQPVSVYLQSSGFSFQHYGGGVLDAYCGTKIDHAALAIGYHLNWSTPFILVKNSWGTGWGSNGYIALALNKNGNFGQCGITRKPSLIPLMWTHQPQSPFGVWGKEGTVNPVIPSIRKQLPVT